MYNNYMNPYQFNSLPTATQPYGYPMPTYNAQNNYNAPTATNTNKIFVNGLDDVRNKPLAPNSDVIYLDNDKPLLYQKIVDSKGQYDVKVFDITPHVETAPAKPDTENYVLKTDFTLLQDELNALKAKLETLLNKEVNINGD